jgi:hypothetical protein
LRKARIRLIFICVGIVAVVASIPLMQSAAEIERAYPTYLYMRQHAPGPPIPPEAILQLQIHLGWVAIGVGACLLIIGCLKYLISFFSYLGTLLRRLIKFVADLSRE